MMVLERGLNALATKVGVSGHHSNWQVIINESEKKLKSLPRGPDLDFYREVNAQFGFLKIGIAITPSTPTMMLMTWRRH
jgi:hypothetical protein